MQVADLPHQWRERAASLRIYAPEVASGIGDCATELEAALQAQGDELLTLPVAAKISGYSEDHLGRLVREGTIPNAGRPNAPRIRRHDLPKKPTRALPTTGKVVYDPDTDARTLRTRRREVQHA